MAVRQLQQMSARPAERHGWKLVSQYQDMHGGTDPWNTIDFAEFEHPCPCETRPLDTDSFGRGSCQRGRNRRTSEWNEPAHGRLSTIAMQMQRGAVTPTLGRRSHRSGAAVFDGIVAWHTRSGRIAGMRFRPQRR